MMAGRLAIQDEDCNWVKGVSGVVAELYHYTDKVKSGELTDAEALALLRSRRASREAADRPSPPLVVKTHEPWSVGHPFAGESSNAVLLVRNPRDMLISAINYRRLQGDAELDAEAFAREFIEHGTSKKWIRRGYGPWFEHYRSWTEQRDVPVHVVRYETLKTEPVEALMELGGFLGLAIGEEAAARAVERSSMENLRKREVEARGQGELSQYKEGYFFINQGRSAQSLDDIAPGLDAAFDARYERELAEMGYGRQPARS
ncbi:MAG: sulfotransferase domain-containing protein [Planctomycetota bacterium]